MSKNNTGQFKKGVSSWNKGISPSLETRKKQRQAKLDNPPTAFINSKRRLGQGHITKNKDGYRFIAYSLVEPEVRQYLKRWGTRPVPEHCYVWCKANKMEIPKGFHIHHMNHIRDDNKIENLLLISHSNHTKLHWDEGKIIVKKKHE